MVTFIVVEGVKDGGLGGVVGCGLRESGGRGWRVLAARAERETEADSTSSS